MAKLHGISEACKDEHRKADVVFIHGLGGDAFGTWRHGKGDDTSWPHWLARDFENVGVWSVDYAASKFKAGRFLKWFVSGLSDKWGYAMPLPKRAGNVLRTLMLNGIGDRPLLLVCHSLGGLVTKEMLRQATAVTADQASQRIGLNTRGILFLATPHRGATLASIGHKFRHYFGTTVAIKDLRAFDHHLLELLGWYSGYAPGRYETVSYCEERLVGEVVRVVDEFSANPGVGPVVPADEDHLSIAKPDRPGHDIVLEARRMLRSVLDAGGPPHGEGTPEPTGREKESETTGEAARVSSPIPRDLQPPGYAFRGRTDLMAALIGRLQQGRSTAVVGDAGMGKTALVVEALQRVLGRAPGEQQAALCRSRFADGIVFLDLYRHHGQAEPAWGALATERGEPTKDSGGNEIPPLQRAIAACTCKRLLLVVEGGEEARGTTEADGFVRTTRAALLDPLLLQHCTVLWLSRRGDQWPTLDMLSLEDPLDDDDARDLFDELAADPATGASRVAPPPRDRALALLHGHPLAITWTAALMASGNVVNADLLTDLADQPSLSLHDPQQKAHTLAWLFDRSVRGLDAEARRSLLAAGPLAPEAFPRAAIAAATGLDNRAQRVALEACLAARLLRLDNRADADSGIPDYRFSHALAYGYAREQALAEPDTAAALLPGLAAWAYAALKAGLAVNASPVVTAAVPRSLAHALALLAADTPPRLWRPLVYALLYDCGDRFVELGQLTTAVAARQAVERWLEQAGAAQSETTQWSRETATCHERLGNLDLARGDLPGAQQHYAASLTISERLIAQDPANLGWQRDLSVSHNKLGEVQQAQGDLPGAQQHYAASLAIAERLAAQDPANAEWQRDLSIGHEKLGDVQQAQGDLPGAQRHYAADLAIVERLAAQDPANAGWQRDLSVSHNKLGDVQQAQGDLSGAQRHYADALAIRERLAAQDPANAGWQRDLSVSHIKLGEVQQALGDLPGAQRHYADGLAIGECLAAQDPANAQWQRDLWVCRNKVGEVQQARGDLPGAQRRYADALAIAEHLAAQDPANSGWQRDLSISHEKLGGLQQAQGDLPGAQRHYTDALAIRERLAVQDPVNASWQRDLAVSRIKLAVVCAEDGNVPGALAHLLAARSILQALRQRAPDHPRFHNDLARVERRIAALEGSAAP